MDVPSMPTPDAVSSCPSLLIYPSLHGRFRNDLMFTGQQDSKFEPVLVRFYPLHPRTSPAVLPTLSPCAVARASVIGSINRKDDLLQPKQPLENPYCPTWGGYSIRFSLKNAVSAPETHLSASRGPLINQSPHEEEQKMRHISVVASSQHPHCECFRGD